MNMLYLTLIMVSSLGVSSVCPLHSSQSTEKLDGKGNIFISLAAETLGQGTEDLLKWAPEKVLPLLLQKAQLITMEGQEVYEKRRKDSQEYQQYCENELIQKAIPAMVLRLCDDKTSSIRDLADAFLLIRFIEEQETEGGNQTITLSYKKLQKRLQEKGKAYKAESKMAPHKDAPVVQNTSPKMNKEMCEFYAGYFFKKILEATSTFCSLKGPVGERELSHHVNVIVSLMDEAVEIEEPTKESNKRITGYSMMQERMQMHCIQLLKSQNEEKAMVAKALQAGKCLRNVKNKKKYRDKRKKQSAKNKVKSS